MSESPEKEEIDDKEKDGQHFKAGGIPGLHFLTCSFGLRPTQHIPFQLQQALQQYKKLSHEYILHNIPDRNCLTTDNTEPQVLSFTSRSSENLILNDKSDLLHLDEGFEGEKQIAEATEARAT